ncbi:MAG TPA: lysozyme inhibitor LprI family protein, partial [Sphingomicrobium sp.]|nr:lysozyme inhibitor LprI family protein [Sphingomicrobium sp.]
DNSSGAVNCSGSLSLDLPPGVGIVGGRQTLTADVDYTVQPAADASGNVVVLRNADSIVAPLATLERVNQPAPTAPGTEQGAPAEMNAAAPKQPETTPSQPPQQPQPPPTSEQASASGHPSFDCAKAHSKGQIAVCANAGLAALDRNMAAQYATAMSGASPEQKELLRKTRGRFMEYRDRCPSRTCIGDAYVGRMREIRDIMEGRWQPPR